MLAPWPEAGWHRFLEASTREVWHPWTASTTVAALSCAKNIFVVGLQIYGSLFATTSLLRRRPPSQWLHDAPHIVKSSSFLAAYGGLALWLAAGFKTVLSSHPVFRQRAFYTLQVHQRSILY